VSGSRSSGGSKGDLLNELVGSRSDISSSDQAAASRRSTISCSQRPGRTSWPRCSRPGPPGGGGRTGLQGRAAARGIPRGGRARCRDRAAVRAFALRRLPGRTGRQSPRPGGRDRGRRDGMSFTASRATDRPPSPGGRSDAAWSARRPLVHRLRVHVIHHVGYARLLDDRPVHHHPLRQAVVGHAVRRIDGDPGPSLV
jgi:hypothetical protein